MEQARRPAAAGPPLWRLRVPACSSRRPAAAGSEGALHPGMANLHAPRGADSLLRPEAGVRCASPPLSLRTDLSLLLSLPCTVAPGSDSPGRVLSLWRAALSNKPTIPCRAVEFCSTMCVAGKASVSRDVGFMFCRAIGMVSCN